MKRVRLYLPLPVSVIVSILTVTAFIFLTLTPNIPIPFPAIPQHITISPFHCNQYVALIKTLHSHFWWYALMIHSD